MPIDPDQLFKPGEIAKWVRVDPKTVTRWQKQGKLAGIRTPGGHWRYRYEELREKLQIPEALIEEITAGRERLLMPAEVAQHFRVITKTVTRWASHGKLKPIKTIGGHRRFLESEVRAAQWPPPQSQ